MDKKTFITTVCFLRQKYRHPRAKQIAAACRYGCVITPSDAYSPEDFMFRINLFKEYGYIVLSKGLKLYHRSPNEDVKFEDGHIPIFTTFDGSWSVGGYVYQLTLKKDIKCLYMVEKDAFANGRFLKGSLHIIYERLFGRRFSDDVCIKNESRKSCKKILSWFIKHKIYAWYSSTEDKSAVEICLFPPVLDEYFDIQRINESEIVDTFKLIAKKGYSKESYLDKHGSHDDKYHHDVAVCYDK